MFVQSFPNVFQCCSCHNPQAVNPNPLLSLRSFPHVDPESPLVQLKPITSVLSISFLPYFLFFCLRRTGRTVYSFCLDRRLWRTWRHTQFFIHSSVILVCFSTATRSDSCWTSDPQSPHSLPTGPFWDCAAASTCRIKLWVLMLLRKKEDTRAVLFRRPLHESQDENTDGDVTFSQFTL